MNIHHCAAFARLLSAIELPLQVGAQLPALHLVDLPKREHSLANDAPRLVRVSSHNIFKASMKWWPEEPLAAGKHALGVALESPYWARADGKKYLYIVFTRTSKICPCVAEAKTLTPLCKNLCTQAVVPSSILNLPLNPRLTSCDSCQGYLTDHRFELPDHPMTRMTISNTNNRTS